MQVDIQHTPTVTLMRPARKHGRVQMNIRMFPSERDAFHALAQLHGMSHGDLVAALVKPAVEQARQVKEISRSNPIKELKAYK